MQTVSPSDQLLQIDESDGVATHSISNLTLQSVDRLSIWTILLRRVRFIIGFIQFAVARLTITRDHSFPAIAKSRVTSSLPAPDWS